MIIWSTGQFNQSPTTIAQWGLGAYARGDYSKAVKAANWLIQHQAPNGGFPLTFDHTNSPNDPNAGWHLTAPWYSAITQGNAISLLARVYSITDDYAYSDAAVRALEPLTKTVAQGGLQGELNGLVWFEETPDPNYPNHIFNGSVFALLGIRDLYEITGSWEALQLWQQGEASLRANINAHIVWAPLQDSSLPDPWMIYDQQVNGFPNVPNYVTAFYAGIHIKLMREMAMRTGSAVYSETADAMTRSLDEYSKTHAS